MDTRKKYLKYKNKYLNFKQLRHSSQHGGKEIELFDNVNSFVNQLLCNGIGSFYNPPDANPDTQSHYMMPVLTTAYYMVKKLNNPWDRPNLTELSRHLGNVVYTVGDIAIATYITMLLTHMVYAVTLFLMIPANFQLLENEYGKDTLPNGSCGHIDGPQQDFILQHSKLHEKVQYFLPLVGLNDYLCDSVHDLISCLIVVYYINENKIPRTFVNQIVLESLSCGKIYGKTQSTRVEDGKIIYLDQQKIECPKGSALTRYRLVNDYIDGNPLGTFHYEYECDLTRDYGDDVQNTSPHIPEADGKINNLEGSEIVCPPGMTLAGLQLIRDFDAQNSLGTYRYNYTCRTKRVEDTYNTPLRSVSDGSTARLDQHDIECPVGTFINAVKVHNSSGNIRYDYKCIK